MAAPWQPESPTPQQRQLLGLATLLQLENRARQAKSPAELAFLMANETLTLLRYQQAVLCRRKKGGTSRIEAVSGVDQPNRAAPYLLWLQRFCDHLLRQGGGMAATGANLPADLQEGGQEWGAHGFWCPLVAPDGEMLGGLWLKRATPWHDAEQRLLAQLAGAYAHAWQALLRRATWRQSRQRAGFGRIPRLLLLGGALAALALPVPLTVLAPAQVVPVAPVLVTSPLKGVVKKFHVTPYQAVEAGQLLFLLDDTELRNRHEVAEKSLAVASAEYQRALQKSLLGKDRALEITILKTRVAQKEAERDYVAEELGRVEVRALRAGTVLFSEVNDWLGRPVVTGEKVMTLADPHQTELEIQVPVDNAINLEEGATVRLFLNTDPARKISGVIRQTSYEATATGDNILAFPVKARIVEGQDLVRIGQQGTAKIYGPKTRLFYYLFRRPWAAARKVLGF